MEAKISLPSEVANWRTKTDPEYTAFCLNNCKKDGQISGLLPNIKNGYCLQRPPTGIVSDYVSKAAILL